MNHFHRNTHGLSVEEVWRRPNLLEHHYLRICRENGVTWEDMHHDIHEAVEAELDDGPTG